MTPKTLADLLERLAAHEGKCDEYFMDDGIAAEARAAAERLMGMEPLAEARGDGGCRYSIYDIKKAAPPLGTLLYAFPEEPTDGR